jgi:hypothetical protein
MWNIALMSLRSRVHQVNQTPPNRQNTQFQKSARKNTFALLQQEHNKKQNNKN